MKVKVIDQENILIFFLINYNFVLVIRIRGSEF